MTAVNIADLHMEDTPTFIATLNIKYGPTDLFGRFFLAADAEMKKIGVTLHLGTFHGLLALNSANRDSWLKLVSTFDPGCNDLPSGSAFCLMGVDCRGDIVATQCARHFDMRCCSITEMAKNLSLFYEYPEFFGMPGERCEVTAKGVEEIKGQVAWSGGGWYRPDFRGKGLIGILPRVTRAYALTQWRIDYAVSIMSSAVYNPSRFKRNGFAHSEGWLKHYNSPWGDIEFMMLWMNRKEILEDTEQFLCGLRRSEDRVDMGDANQ